MPRSFSLSTNRFELRLVGLPAAAVSGAPFEVGWRQTIHLDELGTTTTRHRPPAPTSGSVVLAGTVAALEVAVLVAVRDAPEPRDQLPNRVVARQL